MNLKPHDRIYHNVFGHGTVVKNDDVFHNNRELWILVLFDKTSSGTWTCDGQAPDDNGRFFNITSAKCKFNCDIFCESSGCLRLATQKSYSIYDDLKNMLVN